MKKIIATLVTACLSHVVFPAEIKAIEKTFAQDPVNHPLFPVFVVTLFAAIVFILILIVSIYMIGVVNFLRRKTYTTNRTSIPDHLTRRSLYSSRKLGLYGFLGMSVVLLVVLLITGIISV